MPTDDTVLFNSKVGPPELSNFYEARFLASDPFGKLRVFLHVEMYYQGWKASTLEDFLLVYKERNPRECKKLGRKIKMRGDFRSIQEQVMLTALIHKFTQNPGCYSVLVKTKSCMLQHLSPWDTFWGVDNNGEGINRLGELLMSLRSSFCKDIDRSVRELYVASKKEATALPKRIPREGKDKNKDKVPSWIASDKQDKKFAKESKRRKSRSTAL